VLGTSLTNEFKFGYNAAKSTEQGIAPAGFENIILNLSGSVANTGIAGQGATSGLAIPGGLVRVNSAGNGRSAPYDPYSLTFADSLNVVAGSHFIKMGGDVRMIRMTTDQQGGITYSFANLDAFLANTPATIQYFGDLSEPSPFHNGASGPKHIAQQYYVAFAQDEWHLKPNLTLNYGLRYDFYQPLRESDNRIVKFNIETGTLDPDTTPFYKSKKNNFQPRISAVFTPEEKTVVRGGFGIFVGPGQTEDQIQPVEAERIGTTLSAGAPGAAYPVDPSVVRANFISNPNNRSFQPRAYSNDYTLPEKVYQYTASVQRELPMNMAATVAYVGSQGRNLFLRSIANRTIGVQSNGAAAATQIREFDIVTRNADGTIASIQRPFAEVDYKTSGGHDNYNSMQLSLTRRSVRGLTMNAQYTSATARETRRIQRSRHGEQQCPCAVRIRLRRWLQQLRRAAHVQFQRDLHAAGQWAALERLERRRHRQRPQRSAGARSDSAQRHRVRGRRRQCVQQSRGGPDCGHQHARWRFVTQPAQAGSRSGVDPYVKDGGLLFLNPAAFATPKPGTFGNLTRNQIHGPSFRQLDAVISKRVGLGSGPNVELRAEIFNVFSATNFANPVGTLPNALPAAAITAANVSARAAVHHRAAGTFGRLTSTVGRTVGLGTPRQVQFAIRVSF
jgi:hypothetical protein